MALGGGISDAAVPAMPKPSPMIRSWERGPEGQRQADLGNGYFLNPVFAGDRPDPSVLRDGDDYFAVHASHAYYPGLLIWHSRDLINWRPLGPSLFDNVGSVRSPELVKHDGRYDIYFTAVRENRSSTFVVSAAEIAGPWSKPIDLGIALADPAHAVAADGQRYLFFSGGYRAKLAPGGLSVADVPQKNYGEAEAKARRVEFRAPHVYRDRGVYYLTATEIERTSAAPQPAVVVFRSESLDGPWEYSPANPIVRSRSDETWQGKEHGAVIDAPAGGLFLVYHAREGNFSFLGRQTIFQPMEITSGWLRPRLSGHEVARPIRKSGDEIGPHGFALSDDFSTNKIGIQWAFYDGGRPDAERCRGGDGSLVLRGKGSSPGDSSPLAFIAGDRAFEVEVEVEIDGKAAGGLLLFGGRDAYVGLGFSAEATRVYRGAGQGEMIERRGGARTSRAKLSHADGAVTLSYRVAGEEWQRVGEAIDLRALPRDVANEPVGLRPAIFASGDGEVRFRDVTYRATP